MQVSSKTFRDRIVELRRVPARELIANPRNLCVANCYLPLRHDAGHAQVDFGEALAVIAGEERKIHFFAMDLPHSDACLVQAYPAETSEAFCEGHNVSFQFFGGVPHSILYDNLQLAVARNLGDGQRQRTRVFSELQSHYLFADRFGRPGKGNDKGQASYCSSLGACGASLG